MAFLNIISLPWRIIKIKKKNEKKKKNVLTSESERLTLLNTVGELTDSTYQNVIFSSPPGKGAHLFLEGGGRITLNPQPSTEIVHACVL